MNPSIDYPRLGLTIAMAMLAANLLTFAGERLWTYLEARWVLQAAHQALEEQRAATARQVEESRIQQARQQLELKRQAEKRANAARLNRETCQFWQHEYRQLNSSYNRTMMETSCKRL